MQIPRLTRSALGTCALIAMLAGCNSTGSQQLAPVGPIQQTNVGSRTDSRGASGVSQIRPSDRAFAKSGPDTFPGKNGRIAFLYGLPSINGGDVYTMNSDGTHVQRITHFGPSFATAVGWENWSPDGKLIVFEKWSASSGRSEIWLMNADGTHQHSLRPDPNFFDRAPSFSPHGGWVAFARCFPPGETFAASIERG